MEFRWDNKKSKAKINKTKHDISFEEARSVFLDEYARLKPHGENLNSTGGLEYEKRI